MGTEEAGHHGWRLPVTIAVLILLTGIGVAIFLPDKVCIAPPGVMDLPGPCPDPRVPLRVAIGLIGLVIAGLVLLVAAIRIGRHESRFLQ